MARATPLSFSKRHGLASESAHGSVAQPSDRMCQSVFAYQQATSILKYSHPTNLKAGAAIWKQIKRRISLQGLIQQSVVLEQLVIDSFYELARSTNLAKTWIETILRPSLPQKMAISFCQLYP
jgi:hypothetical protein